MKKNQHSMSEAHRPRLGSHVSPGPGGKTLPKVFEIDQSGPQLTATAIDDFFATLDPFSDGFFVGAGG